MKQLLTVRADGLQAEPEGGQIWFAIFTFNGSSGIDDTLLALARGGVKIRGVLDRGQAHQKWALPPWLKHENLELRVPPKPGPAGFKVRKLHYKTAVVDDRTVVAGSFNYTRPANDFNDVNIFVVGSAYDEIKEPGRTPIQVDAARCRDLALHVRTDSNGSSRSPRSSHRVAANCPQASASLAISWPKALLSNDEHGFPAMTPPERPNLTLSARQALSRADRLVLLRPRVGRRAITSSMRPAAGCGRD
jgi:phosphatidylserine/phosphatidylglycerophosphate/cardiolipin synthase-like enzyme